MPSRSPDVKIISTNRKIHQKFSVLESFEAGLSLYGHEVKSLRAGKVSLDEGLIRVENEEIFLFNVHVPPYAYLSHVDYQPTRTRKLLMHRKEIDRLLKEVQTGGRALVPLELYFKRGKVKVSVGLAKGKKMADRREEIKKREAQREIRQRYAGS